MGRRETCQSCKSTDTGTVRFEALGGGMDMHYCRSCERRWWTSGDRRVDLSDVLAAAAEMNRAAAKAS